MRELDVLRAAGIGGVEINPIKFPAEADPLQTRALVWLSDEWIETLRVVLKGAKELDLTCDMIVGSGWPYGGEFLSRARPNSDGGCRYPECLRPGPTEAGLRESCWMR